MSPTIYLALMNDIDSTIAGWHIVFERPSTGRRYILTVALPDRDASVAVAVSASPHVDEDVIVTARPVTSDVLTRYEILFGEWARTA